MDAANGIQSVSLVMFLCCIWRWRKERGHQFCPLELESKEKLDLISSASCIEASKTKNQPADFRLSCKQKHSPNFFCFYFSFLQRQGLVDILPLKFLAITSKNGGLNH